jgi:hypothetical protein
MVFHPAQGGAIAQPTPSQKPQSNATRVNTIAIARKVKTKRDVARVLN